MTVTYSSKISSAGFATIFKLLLKWRGSVYKLLWREFAVYAATYLTLSLSYRLAMNDEQREKFEFISRYCNRYTDHIPIAFVLGFYVTCVCTRWWNQYNAIPWPDTLALLVTSDIQGPCKRARLFRRTIMRYICLSFTMTLASISSTVKKRFPTLNHLNIAGFLQGSEQQILERLKTPHNKYFVPLVWATSLVNQSRREKWVKDDHALKTLIDEITAFRSKCGTLFSYDWINIPLVYTQVVTVAVYSYFIACLMGRQFSISPYNGEIDVDPYFPFFTFLQFFFFMGWLKVAESLLNPFGEDDDDFDVNYLIDRNLQVSYLIVDDMHSDYPELLRDNHWNDIDFQLPYTQASKNFYNEPFVGSTMDLNISAIGAELTLPNEEAPVIHAKDQPDTLENGDIDKKLKSVKNLPMFSRKVSRKFHKARNNVPGTVFMATNASMSNDSSNAPNDTSILRRLFRNLKKRKTRTKTEENGNGQKRNSQPKEETFNLGDIPLIDDSCVNDSPVKNEAKEEEPDVKVKLDNDEEEAMESKFLMDTGIAHEIV
ncbi:DgyrCDS8026 [Dimorphilus gyrociliatus]|uniref:Bestrophin homolog n=1 Tax=Dimorphilus gyrociliatus TaxID=2664684 RepID=A0A7I8VSY0_9ANNE|nr:DgyrCDS8026 [Dimorphilus gyrociliatus]